MKLRKGRLVGSAAALAATITLSGYGVQSFASTSEVEAPTGDAAYCQAQVAFDTAMLSLGGAPVPDPPDPAEVLNPILDQFEANAPEAVADSVTAYAAAVRGALAGGEDAFEAAFGSPEYMAADAAIDQYLLGACGFNALSVTGTEYQYDGIPATLPAGPTALTFSNEGEEFHMAVLFRMNDGDPLTPKEALALPDEEIFNHLSLHADIFLPPGMSNTGFYDLPAGRYGAACFMPVGSTPGAPEPTEGTPLHYMQGMFEEFTVGDAAEAPAEDTPAAEDPHAGH